MKPRKKDLAIIAAWVVYIVIVGPFLLSARDTLLVLLGFGLLGGLAYLSYKSIRFHIGAKTNA